MAFNPADFPKPSFGFLTGFVDTKGMQIAHVSGETRLGEPLRNLFRLLNADLPIDSPLRIDINGRWNGVLLPGGAEDGSSGRSVSEKSSAIIGSITHRGDNVVTFDQLWFDPDDQESSLF